MYLFVNKKKIEIFDCLSFSSRLMGFMFQKDKIKAGKRFPKCNSIHTFFMKQEIDVIMTDKNNKIVKIFKNLKPNRIIFPQKNVYYTYELLVGVSNFYKVNDILEIKEQKIPM